MNINKLMNFKNILRVVCGATVIIAVYSIITYCQAYLWSDMATANLLIRAQRESGQFFPSTWYYSHADLWVTWLNFFTLPFSLILDNQVLARALGSVLVIVLACVSIRWMSKTLLQSDAYLLIIPMFLLYMIGNESWVLWEASYGMIMLYLAVGFSLFYAVWTRQDIRKTVLLTLFLIIINMGGTREMAELVLPLGIALFLIIYIENRYKTIERCKNTAIEAIILELKLFVPSLVGLVLFKVISARCLNVGDAGDTYLSLSASMTDIWTNFENMIQAFYVIFGIVPGAAIKTAIGIQSLAGMVSCTAIMFVFPILAWRKRTDVSNGEKLLLYYGLVHNTLFVVLFVFFGLNESRYALSIAFVNIIISGQYIYQNYIKKETIQRILWSVVFIVITAIYAYCLIISSKGWSWRVETNRAFVDELKAHGLEKGYADYFYSCSNEVYSDFDLRINPVYIRADGIAEFQWLCDASRFTPEEETKTFLLMTEAEYMLIQPILSEYLGQEYDQFTLMNADGINFYVNCYDYDIISKALGHE